MKDNDKQAVYDDNYFEEEDTLRDRYLTFVLGTESYAFEIRYVTEIIGIQKVTEVPNIKEYIKGIINLRGIIVPIVDVRLRFGMEEIEYDDRACIIVVKVNNTNIGLIVDEVAEVLSIPENQISKPPLTNKGSQSRFIYGMGKVDSNVKIVLDIHKLLYDDDHQFAGMLAGDSDNYDED